MTPCKLVLVEGIPGSGKTTTATFVKRLLDRHDVPNRLFCEGDLDHPADFESVAHFDSPDFEAFLANHAPYRHLLEQHFVVDGSDLFVPYRKLRGDHEDVHLDGLIAELAKRDVYETPLAGTYCRLAAARWRRFVDEARTRHEVTVFETCFLQNPLTVLLGKHNVPVSDALDHIHTIVKTVQPLQPVLVYLQQRHPRATLERAAADRPQAWKEFLITYFIQQGWGKATGAQGFEGVIAFYEMRQRVEFQVIRSADLDYLIIDTDARSWDENQRILAAFLGSALDLTTSP